MKISEKELKERYRKQESDELIKFYKDGELIDMARQALREELLDRGIIIEETIEKSEKQERKASQAAALKAINDSTVVLVVLATLQILVSIGFKFYLGVIFGISMLILAFVLRTKKKQGLALAFVFVGVITLLFNFFGLMVSKMAWGSSVSSLIIIWLGLRCKKAVKTLNM